jgi:apolipoprotein N-acyltransferase
MKKQLYLWLILFALLSLFSTGRLSWTVAAWLGPIFGLRFLQTFDGPAKTRAWHFFLALWAALSVAWYGATPIWGLAHFIFMGFNAAVGMVPYLLHEWVGPRLRPAFVATLTFPLAATAVELLAVTGSPLGNFGAEGYAQFGFDWFVQITAVTGMSGLTFMTTWFAAVINWVWTEWENGRSWSSGLAIYTFALLLVLGYGAVRLATAPTVESGVRVTGLTVHHVDRHELMPLLAEDVPTFRSRTQAIHADYLAETAVAAANGAQIVVWPELAGIGVAEDVAALLAAGAELARETGIYLAIPTMTLDPTGATQAINQLHLLDSNGDEVLTHVKFGGNFIEGTLVGDGVLRIVDTAYGRISAVICWDLDFPAVIAQAGAQDVDILLSVAADWEGIDPLHGQMATFRAVENGLTVVRQADDGWSVIADPYGRILSSASGPVHQQSAVVPTRGVTTIYPQIGEAFGWLALVGLLMLVGWVWSGWRPAVPSPTRPHTAAKRPT